MIGETILGYKVEEKIGSGGFGTVYKVSKTNASGTYIRVYLSVIIIFQRGLLRCSFSWTGQCEGLEVRDE